MTGVLLTNLGTPDAPTPAALRKYLAEFLSDPRVIETPRLLWWPVLHGVILRLRPRRSARAYREVWTEAGSPLLAISKKQCEAIRSALGESSGEPYRVELGMRYGNPSIRAALEKLRGYNIRETAGIAPVPAVFGRDHCVYLRCGRRCPENMAYRSPGKDDHELPR